MNCADCGAEVVQGRNGRWCVESGQRLSPTSRSYTCRTVIQGKAPNAKLVRADYHYVAGEVQRHWPETEDP